MMVPKIPFTLLDVAAPFPIPPPGRTSAGYLPPALPLEQNEAQRRAAEKRLRKANRARGG